MEVSDMGIHPSLRKLLNKAHRCDNLPFMKQLPDNCFDAIITDPPFNAGKQYGRDFDDSKPMDEYMAWMQRRFRQMARILKEGGSLIFKYPSNRIEIIGQFLPSALTAVRAGVWEKPFSPIRYTGTGWSWHFELIVWWAKGNPVCRGTWNESDVIKVNPVCKAIKHPEFENHPCQMPIELCRYLIRRFSKAGDVILDPFLGSGSMAVAAELEKRNWIGTDIESDYIDLTNQRLNLPRQTEFRL